MFNNQSKLFIILDALTLIVAVFGALLSKNNVVWTAIGGIACVLLVFLLYKGFGRSGVVIGALLSILLMTFMIIQFFNSPPDEFTDKISEETQLGDLRISIEELIVEYRDEDGNKRIANDVNIEQDICDEIIIKSVDYDVVLEDYNLQDGKIVFYNIPVGTYDIKIQLEGFSLYSGVIKLKESDLEKNFWNKSICIQSDNDYRDFQIVITDNDGITLDGYKCDFSVLGTDHEIKDIVSDSQGKLPYVFRMPNDLRFQLTLHYDNEETYISEYSVDEVTNPLNAQFSTPPKEKIPVTEVHQPDDSATIVSLPEWNANEDIGIDGKRYGGGIKVSISDMFISMGSNSSKDIVSRIIVPLDESSGETIFEGVFVLDQTMYGSNSTGTISILINDEEVFTTGEIGGNTLNAFPFKIDFGDAESLIILTKAHLSGSDFVYGFVSEN